MLPFNQVQAVDPDLGENGRVTYRLADSMGDRFAINPYTKEIIVKHLMREDYNKELVLKVIAQDRGQLFFYIIQANFWNCKKCKYFNIFYVT